MKPLLLLASLTLIQAQDLTGRWTGIAQTIAEAGTRRQESQTFEIKSENGKLTGIRVSKSGTGGTPIEIQQEGPKVNFYSFLAFEGGEPLRWKLEWKDGQWVGTFSAQHHSPKKWIYDRIGPITLTKVEPK
jgi:hypothetical protein